MCQRDCMPHALRGILQFLSMDFLQIIFPSRKKKFSTCICKIKKCCFLFLCVTGSLMCSVLIAGFTDLCVFTNFTMRTKAYEKRIMLNFKLVKKAEYMHSLLHFTRSFHALGVIIM